MNELIIPIEQKIHEIRGQKVMLDFDLSEMYQVETKVLNQSVKRNIERFPERYMFQLTKEEFKNLKSQIVTSSYGEKILKFQTGTSSWGGTRKLPFAFTDQGVAMLSAVLHTDIAVQVSINIMDAFVAVRNYLANNVSVLKEIEALKKEMIEMRKDIDLLKRSERKRIKEKNTDKRDTVETPVDQLIKMYYRKPEENEKGIFCMLKDILHDLIVSQKIPRNSDISVEHIGKALTNQGYKNISKRVFFNGKSSSRRSYIVMQSEEMSS
ncbi:hypothetical protein EZS27_022959 [termite gut metagenome]|uniref:KilA-N DNA-binding domain-containing protein n=1 Tax=termite gut metagenome TaxID=433724 RepID=A0A5J4R6A3_9ZZZZ